LRRPEGATITPEGQLIPPAVAPVPGRTTMEGLPPRAPQIPQLDALERQYEAVDNEVQQLQSVLDQPAMIKAMAEGEGAKPAAVRARLTSALNAAKGRRVVAQAERDAHPQYQARQQREANAARRMGLRQWFYANAAPELRADAAQDDMAAPVAQGRTTTVSPERAREIERYLLDEAVDDPTSVADKDRLLGMLNSTANKRKSDKNLGGAYAYFSKYPIVRDAISAIAWDLATPGVPKIRRRGAEALSPLETQTGTQNATRARDWMNANLSPEANAFLEAEMQDLSDAAISAAQNAHEQTAMAARARNEADAATLAPYLGKEEAKKQQRAREAAEAAGRASVGTDLDAARPVSPPRAAGRGGVSVAPGYEKIFRLAADVTDHFLGPRRTKMLSSLTVPLHPDVVRALRRGNLRLALQTLADTATDRYTAKLAQALIPYVGDTKVYLSGNDPTVRDLLRSPETGLIGRGGYLLRTAERQAELMANPENRGYAEDTNNAVFLNSDTGLNARTLLHEMLHVATMKHLMNPASPVRARLEKLRLQVVKAIGDGPATANVMEFTAEAFTNFKFQNLLAQLYVNDVKVPALTQFRYAIVNMARRIMGLPMLDYAAVHRGVDASTESVMDEVDFLVRTIFDVAPEARMQGSLYEDALIPLRARARVDGMTGRVKDFLPTDKAKLDTVVRGLSGGRADRRTMSRFLLDAFVPYTNLRAMAAPYLGEKNLQDLHEVLGGHSTRIQDLLRRVDNSVQQIADLLPTAEITDKFNTLRLLATQRQIDPRHDEKVYREFGWIYRPLNADGVPQAPVLRTHATAAERAAAIKAHNATVRAAEDAGRAPTALRGKALPDPDLERLADYRELRRMWDEIGPDGQKAFELAVGLYKNLHTETVKAIKVRLAEMLPDDTVAQRSLYIRLMERVLSDSLVMPYQPLQREGDLGLTYQAVHPGDQHITTFHHRYKSEGERAEAVEVLRRLADEDPSLQISDVRTYNKTADLLGDARRPPSKFVADIGRALDQAAVQAAETVYDQTLATTGNHAQATAARDAALAVEKERADATRASIVELALDLIPERSLLQAYRKRQGVAGFLGDKNLVGQQLTKADTIRLMREKGSRIARQVADMEYGSRGRAAVNQMETDLAAKYDSLTPEQQVDAGTYLESMKDYAASVYGRRGPLSSAANGITYHAMLGANISSAFMSTFAFPAIIAPYLGSRYGMRATVSAIGRATRTYASTGRRRTEERIGASGGVETVSRKTSALDYSLDNMDLNPTDYLYPLQDIGRRHGFFHTSMHQAALNLQDRPALGVWSKMNVVGSYLFHHIERYVRETTFIAAYDLETQRMKQERKRQGRSQDLTVDDLYAAAREAAYNTEKTNGGSVAAMSQKYAKGDIGSMLYLFRRYPLAMYNLIFQTANEAFPGKKKLAALYGENSPEYINALENRKVARWQLGGVLGGTAVMSGVSGLPLYGAVAALFNTLFSDDDEVDDFDSIVRGSLGELGFKGVGNYFFGVELSSRIGLADMFYREPLRADDQPLLMNLIEGAGGPVISQFVSTPRRVYEHLNNGEYWRATEAAAPAALRNIMRAGRFADEGGARTLRGDAIYDDFGPYSLFAQAIGFSNAAYIRQLEKNNALKKVDIAITAEKSKLMRRANLAKRSGDTEALRTVYANIRDFNARHPQQRITAETLRDSERTFKQTTARTINGMIFNTKNIPYLQQQARLFEGDATFWE